MGEGASQFLACNKCHRRNQVLRGTSQRVVRSVRAASKQVHAKREAETEEGL